MPFPRRVVLAVLTLVAVAISATLAVREAGAATRQAEGGPALQLEGHAVWVETDRSVELKLKVARAAQAPGTEAAG
jgi:hypothetical protein